MPWSINDPNHARIMHANLRKAVRGVPSIDIAFPRSLPSIRSQPPGSFTSPLKLMKRKSVLVPKTPRHFIINKQWYSDAKMMIKRLPTTLERRKYKFDDKSHQFPWLSNPGKGVQVELPYDQINIHTSDDFYVVVRMRDKFYNKTYIEIIQSQFPDCSLYILTKYNGMLTAIHDNDIVASVMPIVFKDANNKEIKTTIDLVKFYDD